MGVLSGSIAYTKYYVEGALPADFRDHFVERARHFVFVPLRADEEEEERTGWCSVEHPFDLELDEYKLYFNEYLNLGMRTDKWRLPGPVVKAHMTEAERKYLEENKKAKLSKAEKEDLKLIVEGRLKEKLLPAMRVVDMSWNLNRGELRFWTQSAKVCEHFEALFEETFGMRLVLEAAYTAALERELDEGLKGRLESIEPSVFHGDEAA